MRNLMAERRWLKISLMILMLFFLLPATNAFAQNDTEQMQNERQRDLADMLNLSVEQREQIRKIREENAVEHRAARQRYNQAQRALDEAIYAENANEAMIEERAREVGAAQAQLLRLRVLTELKIRRVLTDEQLNTLRQLRQQARRDAREQRRMDNALDPERERRQRERLRGRPGERIQDNQNIRPPFPPNQRRDGMLRGRRP